MIEAQKLYEMAKQQAFELQVPTDEILEPLLIKHGYVNGKGVTLVTHAITIGWDEDTSKVPTEGVNK